VDQGGGNTDVGDLSGMEVGGPYFTDVGLLVQLGPILISAAFRLPSHILSP